MDRLYAYFDPATPRMPEGCAEIPLDWRGVWACLGALAGAGGILFALLKLFQPRNRRKKS